jgi:hypothetical protein
MLFHLYADDTQLYISFSCNDDQGLQLVLTCIENCLSDIDEWMTLSKLKLNKDKTELLFLYSRHSPELSFPLLRFGSDMIKHSDSAKSIGVIFDSTMTMIPHVKTVYIVSWTMGKDYYA